LKSQVGMGKVYGSLSRSLFPMLTLIYSIENTIILYKILVLRHPTGQQGCARLSFCRVLFLHIFSLYKFTGTHIFFIVFRSFFMNFVFLKEYAFKFHFFVQPFPKPLARLDPVYRFSLFRYSLKFLRAVRCRGRGKRSRSPRFRDV